MEPNTQKNAFGISDQYLSQVLNIYHQAGNPKTYQQAENKSMFCFFPVKGTAEFAGLDQRAVSNRGDARQGQSEFPLLICCLNENLHNKRLKFSSVKRPTRFRFGGKMFLIILKIIIIIFFSIFLFIHYYLICLNVM